MYSIDEIATLITEDPDVFDVYGNRDIDVFAEGILCEAQSEKYLNAFNKSPVRVGALADAEGNAPLLKDLPDEAKIQIIDQIKAIVEPGLAKYEQYFVRQVAAGNMPLKRLEEDSSRLNMTVAKFVKHARKAYWKQKGYSTSILDFPDWRELERTINDLEDNHIEYDKKDSGVLYSKKYVNNVMSLLFGDPPEVMVYYFRKVDCFENSKKYGTGTSWCTSKSKRYFEHYHGANGLYIVELETPTVPRRPVYQISGSEQMDRDDVSISRFGPRFADFMEDILEHFGEHLSSETVQQVQTTLSASKPEEEKEAGPPPLQGVSFCFTGTRQGIEEVTQLGADITSGVSKVKPSPDFLIQKDTNKVSNKTKNAAANRHTKIVSLDDLGLVLGHAEQGKIPSFDTITAFLKRLAVN